LTLTFAIKSGFCERCKRSGKITPTRSSESYRSGRRQKTDPIDDDYLKKNSKSHNKIIGFGIFYTVEN
jgi:hypothetical protein